MKQNSIKGIIFILITAIIWGGAFIAQVYGDNVGSFLFNGYRCIFALIAVGLLIYIDNFINYKRIMFFRFTEDVKKTILNSFWCGFILFLAINAQQIGVGKTTSAKAGLIAALEAVVVPIMCLIFFKRKIKLITWFFIILSMLGTMTLSMGSIDGFNIGDFWVLISTILYSITILQIPKYCVGVDPLKFSFFRFVIVGALCFIFGYIRREPGMDISIVIKELPSILYCGIFASGVAYTLQILGQQNCEPIVATLLMSLEGVFAAIFGWILLGQSLNFIQIFGIVLSFASIVFVQITDYKQN